ncbi:DNA-binding protein [Streptomyces sp. NPDC005970]|uniref:DNA-binding protein n=1 Tax=Streptomyces sp. NPDC005970 TaxID=3156723 RepID=UPI0034027534
MTARAALTIAEILDQPALVPLWPTVGRALGLAESTTYQLAAENRLPFEVIRLGRRRVARTVDLHRFLGLAGNDDSAGAATPTPSVEHVNESTGQQIRSAQ